MAGAIIDDAALAGTRLGLGFRLALLVMLSVATFPVLVALLAPPAPPLGINIIAIKEGSLPSQHRESGKQAQQAATGAQKHPA